MITFDGEVSLPHWTYRRAEPVEPTTEQLRILAQSDPDSAAFKAFELATNPMGNTKAIVMARLMLDIDGQSIEL